MEVNDQHRDWIGIILEEAELADVIETLAAVATENAKFEAEESLSPSPERAAAWLQAATVLRETAPKLRIAAIERTTSR